MDKTDVFRRREVKYLLTMPQREALLQEMSGRMRPDDYAKCTLRSVYFDTEDFRLIRRSLEKPIYKEKLRLRSYQKAGPTDTVFVELKKKYRDVVIKRRLADDEGRISRCFREGQPLETDSQIGREIDAFRRFYVTLRPTVFLSCEREAYRPTDGTDLRLTLDDHILWRGENFSLGSEIYGAPLFKEDKTLLEVKTAGGMPLWLAHFLSREQISKTSFSKYGAAYRAMSVRSAKGGFQK